MKARYWYAAAVFALMVAGCGGGGKTAGTTTSGKPDVGLLFVQAAPHGTFVAVPGAEDRYTLTLRDSASQVMWFSDRPSRHYGHVTIERFIGDWMKFGFGSDPPNAALTLLRHEDTEDTVIIELGTPRYDAERHTLQFPARRILHANGRLADFEDDNDGTVPERFEDVSLFIDDTSSWGGLCHGCQY
jgi:hypothetical protein